jgi:hypothetical protein
MDEDEAIDVPVQALLPGRKAMVVRLTSKPGMRAALLDTLNTMPTVSRRSPAPRST